MFEVNYKDINGNECCEEFETLTLAIDRSILLNKFVTISFDGNQLVGKFGVDSIEQGCLPNGDNYSWKKRRQ